MLRRTLLWLRQMTSSLFIFDWLFHKKQGAICSLDPSLKAADHDGSVDISWHPKSEEHRKSGLSLIGLNLFHPPEWRSFQVETT